MASPLAPMRAQIKNPIILAMMQYVVDPCAFARSPPLSLFGVGSCARPTIDVSACRPPPPGFFGVRSCAWLTVDVPAHRPPPPGFFDTRCLRGVLPLALCEVPVPPKLPKRMVDKEEHRGVAATGLPKEGASRVPTW